MRASQTGIEINKAELGALLFFAGKSDTAVVKFRIDGKQKLVVSASDGKRAVECQAPGGDAERGEWTVPGYWLERQRRGLDKGRTELLLKPKSNELKRACMIGAASREEQSEDIDKTNGTSTQVSMESLHSLTKGEIPLDGGTWFAFVPKHVNKAFDVLSKAADGCPVTVYPPNEPTAQILFACSSEHGRWRGILQPALVEGPGGESEEADEDDDDPPGRQPSLPGARAKAAVGKGNATEDADDEDEAEEEGDDGIVPDDYLTRKKPKVKKTPKAATPRKKGANKRP